jgi:hypothetical protein
MQKRNAPSARVFAVETRFQKMARREGGVPRDRAIEQAQATIEEAKPGFDRWFNEELQKLKSLIECAASGHAEPDWIEKANFQCRQLRDSATPLGFELLAFIANSLSEILDAIEAGSECHMESINCHLDALLLAARKSYYRLKLKPVP